MARAAPRPDLPPFAPKDLPLRRDVRLLGGMLGRILSEQGGEELLARVEAARRSAIQRRSGGADADLDLARQLHGLPAASAHEVVRAFSAWFEVVNLAERVHRVRRLRAHARQPGGVRAVLAALRGRGFDAGALRELLERTVVEPVLTAHPTEALRRTLLVKELCMARALLARPAGAVVPARAQARALARVREELTASWQTAEQRAERPSVADEVEQALFYLSDVAWRAVPRVHARLRRALERELGPEAVPARGPALRFGTWVGGDMDGNPAVGPDTVRATLARQSELALGLHLRAVRALFRRLSQSASRVEISAELAARLARLEAEPALRDRPIPARYADMPYRRFLWLVAARLEATQARGAGAYPDARAFEDDLACVADSLRRHRGEHAGLRAVERQVLRARCFGFHLATLDVRRDALDHRAALAELLAEPGFAQRTADERRLRLAALLEAPALPGLATQGAAARFALDVMRAVADVRRAHGDAAVGLFVVSMAQGADDVLAVLCLARAADTAAADGRVPLDVAPLFETVDDLTGAPRTLERLLADPLYRAHVAARGDVQWVMLGYSDSNKTSGIVAARVALQAAQRELASVAARHAVELRFFHGRGGSISRGGSKPRAAVLASPPGTVRGHLRVTEQGEIVRAKYGLVDVAERTLELLLAATLERTALDARAAAPDLEPGHDVLAEMAAEGRRAYRALVEAPGFVEYFQTATPIDAIERMALGSRPSRRRALRGVEDLRAIPWVFAWTQSRHMLPGWFGAGSALQRALDAHGLPALRALARRSSTLQPLLRDVEMVLAKSDLRIARLYAALAGAAGAPFLARIEAEHERTCALVLEVLERPHLLAGDPVLRRAILLRNPYVDPLSFVQVDLLARWRAGGRADAALERALIATVHGIARGLQNTG